MGDENGESYEDGNLENLLEKQQEWIEEESTVPVDDENNDLGEELENEQKEGWYLWLYKLYNADIYFIQPIINVYNYIDLFS